MPFIELRVQLHDEAFETNLEARTTGEDLASLLSSDDRVYAVTVTDSPQPTFKDGEAQ